MARVEFFQETLVKDLWDYYSSVPHNTSIQVKLIVELRTYVAGQWPYCMAFITIDSCSSFEDSLAICEAVTDNSSVWRSTYMNFLSSQHHQLVGETLLGSLDMQPAQ